MRKLSQTIARSYLASQFGGTQLLVVALALGLIIAGLLKLPPVIGANDASRWNTVWSLSEGQGYIIDHAPYSTIDKAFREGHFYSSKPPVLPTLLAGPAWLIKIFTGWRLPDEDFIVVRMILFFLNLIPFGIVLVLYRHLLNQLHLSKDSTTFCLSAAAFGTYLTAYSTTLNNHTVAATGAFFSLYCLIQIHYVQKDAWWLFALCGLFASWTTINELPAVLFLFLISAFLFYNHRKKTLAYFLPPALLLLGTHFYLTYLSAGDLLPYYVKFHTDLYRYQASWWMAPQGIDAANDPKWVYLLNSLVGHHGILSLTPLFLLSFYGLIRPTPWSIIHYMGLGLFLYLLVIYTVFTHNYGGVCQGARWFFWLIPFWLISLAPVVARHFHSRRFRTLAWGCLSVSFMSVLFVLISPKGPWDWSWMERLMRAAGWIDY